MEIKKGDAVPAPADVVFTTQAECLGQGDQISVGKASIFLSGWARGCQTAEDWIAYERLLRQILMEVATTNQRK